MKMYKLVKQYAVAIILGVLSKARFDADGSFPIRPDARSSRLLTVVIVARWLADRPREQLLAMHSYSGTRRNLKALWR